jgi:nitric oxide reductase NorE protein
MTNATAPTSAPEADHTVPGQIDIWYFVLFEVLIFSSYFITYMLYRVWNTDLYLQSQAHLNQHFGALNTVILLVSSWLIARSVHAARTQQFEVAQRLVYLTIFCGLLFLASKFFEWSSKIREGYEFSTNQFFSFYYFLTGIHVLHVLIGFVFLSVVIYQLRSPRRRSMPVIESGAIYWHMVDFLWVIIFALLYVMR